MWLPRYKYQPMILSFPVEYPKENKTNKHVWTILLAKSIGLLLMVYKASSFVQHVTLDRDKLKVYPHWRLFVVSLSRPPDYSLNLYANGLEMLPLLCLYVVSTMNFDHVNGPYSDITVMSVKIAGSHFGCLQLIWFQESACLLPLIGCRSQAKNQAGIRIPYMAVLCLDL